MILTSIVFDDPHVWWTDGWAKSYTTYCIYAVAR